MVLDPNFRSQSFSQVSLPSGTPINADMFCKLNLVVTCYLVHNLSSKALLFANAALSCYLIIQICRVLDLYTKDGHCLFH